MDVVTPELRTTKLPHRRHIRSMLLTPRTEPPRQLSAQVSTSCVITKQTQPPLTLTS